MADKLFKGGVNLTCQRLVRRHYNGSMGTSTCVVVRYRTGAYKPDGANISGPQAGITFQREATN